MEKETDEIYSRYSGFQLEEPTVVTLGKFDGRHRGHQKLLHTMEELKETLAMQLLFLPSAQPH